MADAPRRWFRFRIRTLLLLTLLAVVGLSIYSYWSDYSDQAARRARSLLSPARGAYCTVILRYDVLGMAPSASTTPWTERRDNVVAGKFYLMNDQWIVVDVNSRTQQWIPRQHVLMLRVEE